MNLNLKKVNLLIFPVSNSMWPVYALSKNYTSETSVCIVVSVVTKKPVSVKWKFLMKCYTKGPYLKLLILFTDIPFFNNDDNYRCE